MAFLSRLQNCLSGKSVTAKAISIGINGLGSQVDIYSSGKPKELFVFVLSFFKIKNIVRKCSKVSFETFQVGIKRNAKNASNVTIKNDLL